MKRRRAPITQPAFAKALGLCQRPQGANTDELSDALPGVVYFDAPGVLRNLIEKYRSDLRLYSEKRPHKSRGWRGKLHGNRLTYFVKSRGEKRGGG